MNEAGILCVDHEVFINTGYTITLGNAKFNEKSAEKGMFFQLFVDLFMWWARIDTNTNAPFLFVHSLSAMEKGTFCII